MHTATRQVGFLLEYFYNLVACSPDVHSSFCGTLENVMACSRAGLSSMSSVLLKRIICVAIKNE